MTALVWATRNRGGADAGSPRAAADGGADRDAHHGPADRRRRRPPLPTTVPPTAAPTTTQQPTTTVAADDDGVPQATVDDVLAAMVQDPTLFGVHTFEVVSVLARIDGRGNDAKQAADLLDRVDRWVDDGEIDESAADLLRGALTPIAERRGDDD